tara:strand:- start:42097 stop:42411 length:315 start_codon:yes stop_codon:yes gene_type:complete
MNKIKKLIGKIPKPLKNKYFITLLAFSFWILFIDDYNLIKQYHLYNNINKLKKQKGYYLTEIERDSTQFYRLQHTKEEQEKFAREKFMMKKEKEDIFIIRKKEK